MLGNPTILFQGAHLAGLSHYADVALHVQVYWNKRSHDEREKKGGLPMPAPGQLYFKSYVTLLMYDRVIYMYIYIYINIHTYIHTYTYIYIGLHTHTLTHTSHEMDSLLKFIFSNSNRILTCYSM